METCFRETVKLTQVITLAGKYVAHFPQAVAQPSFWTGQDKN